MVVCPYNAEHEFPAVYEVEDESTGVESTATEYCPYCKEFVEVQIQGRLEHDTEVIRRFGFEQ